MSETRNCPECGATMPPDAPEGLCPECLLKKGMQTNTDIGGVQGTPASFVPPEVTELADKFPQLEILELVGHGGMGAVYKARQMPLDRMVALKIVNPQSAADPAFAERFMREAKALARLNHPNVVTVHEFGEADGMYFFVMEFVDGPTLRQLIESGSIQPREALAIVPQICEALQYAHEEGIVHRDIKPENILMDRRGRVKIADFGLAKLLGMAPADLTLTGTQQVMGTLHYMAPEQMERPLEVDHRADIYSLGVVFYEALTGELPLGRFAPPSQKVAVDVRFDEVVLRTLEREPAQRYQRVSEVKTELESIAGTETIMAAGPAHSNQDDQARRDVKGPAIGLVVTGLLNWIAICGCLVYLAVAQVPTSQTSLVGALAAVMFLFSGLIFFGALKMMRLESRGFAIAAAILAMIFTPGNLIGLPIGIWALVALFQRDVRLAFHARSERDISMGDQAHVCKLPVVGAAWAPFGLITLALMFIVVPVVNGEAPEVTVWQWLARLVILPLGVLAPFASTTLGCLGISRIRRSHGRLIGMPLAVVVALFYPLLILDGILVIIAIQLAPQEYLNAAIALGLLVAIAVDVLIVWWVLRASATPPGDIRPTTPQGYRSAAVV